MQQQEFNFKFMVIGIKATANPERITIKMGLRKLEAPWASLRHLYIVDHGPDAGTELLLAHEPAPGKKKVFRLTADYADPEFHRFIETVVAGRPDIDIRNLNSQAAHRLIGATNFAAIVPWVMPPLFVLIFAIGFLPWLVHGVDGGHTELQAADFASSGLDPDSRNALVKNGMLLDDDALTIETTQDGRTSIEWVIPLVPPDWEAGDPVHLVVKTEELSIAEAQALDPVHGIEGVLRNVLWEGLGSDEADYFKSNLGLELSDDVQELEYGADTTMELYFALGILVFVGVLMLIISIVIARKSRARQT